MHKSLNTKLAEQVLTCISSSGKYILYIYRTSTTQCYPIWQWKGKELGGINCRREEEWGCLMEELEGNRGRGRWGQDYLHALDAIRATLVDHVVTQLAMANASQRVQPRTTVSSVIQSFCQQNRYANLTNWTVL